MCLVIRIEIEVLPAGYSGRGDKDGGEAVDEGEFINSATLKVCGVYSSGEGGDARECGRGQAARVV